MGTNGGFFPAICRVCFLNMELIFLEYRIRFILFKSSRSFKLTADKISSARRIESFNKEFHFVFGILISFGANRWINF